MKIFGVCVTFFEPLKQIFLFHDRILQFQKYNIFGIQFMKESSICFILDQDKLLLNTSYLFFHIS